MVVNDEPAMVRFARDRLQHAASAVNCHRGVLAIREATPSRLLLDAMMPEMDGFETLRRIRQLSSVPIIPLTARTSDPDKPRGFEYGADDYLTASRHRALNEDISDPVIKGNPRPAETRIFTEPKSPPSG
jgi:two-component system KDP operon response regulator KdpE